METFYWKIRRNVYNYDVIDINDKPFQYLQDGDFDVTTKNPLYRGKGLETMISCLKLNGWEYPLTPAQEHSNYIHAHWAKPNKEWIEMVKDEIAKGTKHIDVPLLY